MTDARKPADAPAEKPDKPVAEEKSAGKPVEAASAAPGEKRSASRPRLARASESGDPAVQKLLADRWTAQQNAAMHHGGAGSATQQKAGHEAQVAEADAALAELGYE